MTLVRDRAVAVGLDLPRRFLPVRHSGAAVRTRVGFAALAAAADAGAIVTTAIATGTVYHLALYGDVGVAGTLLQLGSVVAALVLFATGARHDYDIGRYLDIRDHVRRVFQVWNVAFLAGMALGFFTKTSDLFSRGTVVLFYVLGFLALIVVRRLLVRLVQIASKTGTVEARRIYLVGDEAAITEFARCHQPWNLGMRIVGMSSVADLAATDEATLDGVLAEAVRDARRLKPDDVMVFMPAGPQDAVDRAIEAFLTTPASIHLASERVFGRFKDARIARTGSLATIELVRRPLTMVELVQKRLFDVVVALVGLVLLAPLFATIAVAIKLDSPGPVFFRQRRYGFNQETFRILKFRTMTVLEDGPVVSQATAHDPRITTVGRVLRRWNLDELPQLVNVLIGQMSLVGPRPHALAHDRAYERRIALYARRHNVLPGITGWAQVNGFRGETDTDDKMRARVEHDLHYIDNWSLFFDLGILLATVFSARSYRNAR